MPDLVTPAPYRDFAYPLNVFMHILTREGGPVEALHYGLFESAGEPLSVAQERTTDLLLAKLPPPPARLLEVGIGLGTLLRRLTNAGYEVEGLTPDARQMEMVRARHGDRVNASCVRFEDFAATPARPDVSPAAEAFDAIVFQESSQYIDSAALFAKASALTARVLVQDEFALQPTDAADALRSRSDFLAAATMAGFHIVDEIDLSEQAAPTIEYFLARMPRHRDALAQDLGLSDTQIDDLLASGQRYLDLYRRGIYGYRLFDLRKDRAAHAHRDPSETYIVDPFLHVMADRIDSPVTGRTQRRGDAGHTALLQLLAGSALDTIDPATRHTLAADGWLVSPGAQVARRSRLRVVSIETHAACNQSCYFCPVSIAPREDERMSDALFDDIVRQLAAFRETLEGVFFSGYNEPTLDSRFVDHCARLLNAGLPVAVNTNASGLTPARIDRLLEAGTLRLLSINLSTLDRDRYAHDRGRDHLGLVLRNLDYAKDRPVATDMIIAVLGAKDEAHRRDFDRLRARFAGSRFDVQSHAVMDRAGHLPLGLKPDASSRLRGCENLGSRPLHHLHITAAGQCVFCCEDYDERYVVGDLRTTSIVDVLRGDELARLRRWSYGVDAAPADFICHRCIFALRG